MFQYQYLFWSLLNQVEHVEMLDLKWFLSLSLEVRLWLLYLFGIPFFLIYLDMFLPFCCYKFKPTSEKIKSEKLILLHETKVKIFVNEKYCLTVNKGGCYYQAISLYSQHWDLRECRKETEHPAIKQLATAVTPRVRPEETQDGNTGYWS